MIKILTSSKDTYIQNRKIKNVITTDANVGKAPTLDLFKITKIDSNNNIRKEISRLLINFDINEIKNLSSSGTIDINSNSFKVNLLLKDIQSAQTTPEKFTLKINPLNKAFDEGSGIDIISYDDIDVCNFLTASIEPFVTWSISGAASSGSFGSNIDQIINSGSNLLEVTQFFQNGTEDLNVDVTNIIKSYISESIPNHGFIISFSGSIENDNNTYFVKRFASNQAFDKFYRPTLTILYDDSKQDDLPYGLINITGSTFFYNINNKTSQLQNINSGSSVLTGSNCLLFNLKCKNTSSVDLFFTGSQINSENGKYISNFIINDSGDVAKILNSSGSIKFEAKWMTLDKSVDLSQKSEYTFSRSGTQSLGEDEIVFNIKHVKSEYKNDEIVKFPLFIYNKNFNLKLTKLPVEKKTLILRNLKYSIRDIESNKRIVDFSDGTKISNDAEKCYFVLDFKNLISGRSYVVDLLNIDSINGTNIIIKNVSSIFKVTEN